MTTNKLNEASGWLCIVLALVGIIAIVFFSSDQISTHFMFNGVASFIVLWMYGVNKVLKNER